MRDGASNRQGRVPGAQPRKQMGKAVGKGFQESCKCRMKAKKAVPPCRTARVRNEQALLFRLVDFDKLLEEIFELTY